MGFELTQEDVKALTDDQKVAIMESLLIAVLADGRAEKQEVVQFDQEVERVPWGIERSALAGQMEAARGRILQLKGAAVVLPFIGSVASRLPTEELREKVFRAMCAIMATSDLNPGEKNVMFTFATAFRIPLPRLDAIKADVSANLKSE